MPTAPLWRPKARPPPLDELARRPIRRLWFRLRSALGAADNILTVYHPDLYDRPWDVVSFGGGRLVVINDPDAARRVLVENADNYEKGPLYQALLGDFLGEGSLLMDNAGARERRRIVTPALNGRALRRLERVVERHVETMIARWRRMGPEIGLSRELQTLAMAIAMEAFFSTRLGPEQDPLADLLQRLSDAAGSPSAADILMLPGWIPRRSRRRVRRWTAELDALLYPLIDARLARRDAATADAPDMLDLLVHARDAETGASLSRREIRDEVTTLFMAGHETTALSLAWGLDDLARAPAAEAALVEAARAVKEPLDCAGAQALPEARRAYDEMLRLHPPAYVVTRSALRNDMAAGLRIEPEDQVDVAVFMLHRNARYWSEPGMFDPDRFARGEPRHPQAFLPFGAGPRICVGSGLDRMEGRLIVGRIAQTFRIAPAGPPPEPVGKVTLHARGPIRLRLRQV